MAIHRCSMCGGTLEIEENGGYVVCSYCGLREPITTDNDSSNKSDNSPSNAQNKALRIENERRRAEEAKAKAEASRVQAEESRLKAETQRLERERLTEKQRMERAKRSKKIRSVVGKVFLSIIAITLVVILTFTLIIPSVKYSSAVKAVEEQNYEEAYLTFKELNKFKDSKDRASQILREHPSVAQVGDVIVFGAYEQDNKASNGKEEIEWKVLDKDADGNLFVISVYALDCRNYHSSVSKVTWETSDMRKWLNNDFYNSAFDENQKNNIKTTALENRDNTDYNTDGGKDTKDKIFLLSIDEATAYMPSTLDRICDATKYAESQGSQLESLTRSCRWWLRSPGSTLFNASFVKVDGFILQMGTPVSIEKRSVRPAMWLEF